MTDEGPNLVKHRKGNPRAHRRRYWFCFTFQGVSTRGDAEGRGVVASTYAGLISHNINLATLAEQREQAGVHEDAVLLGTSYLGRMTETEFFAEAENSDSHGEPS